MTATANVSSGISFDINTILLQTSQVVLLVKFFGHGILHEQHHLGAPNWR
jgi:hypothetical protein